MYSLVINKISFLSHDKEETQHSFVNRIQLLWYDRKVLFNFQSQADQNDETRKPYRQTEVKECSNGQHHIVSINVL